MRSRRLKSWYVAVYLLVLATCLLVGGWLFQEINGRLKVSEKALVNFMNIEATDKITIKTTGGLTRTFYRSKTETRIEWLDRVKRDAERQPLPGEYICTTLEGCDPPIEEIEICTWCDTSPPTDECAKRHELNVEEACIVFGCDCD